MITEVIHRIPWDGAIDEQAKTGLLEREWLVCNGLGGYASGSVYGVPTRRYHGLLIASTLSHPGRAMLLNHVEESIHLPDTASIHLSGYERGSGEMPMDPCRYLREFRVEWGIPIWTFVTPLGTIEKRITIIYNENTVVLLYRLLDGARTLSLHLKPYFHFRGHNDPLSQIVNQPCRITVQGKDIEIGGNEPFPAIRMRYGNGAGRLILDGCTTLEAFYREEGVRGYECREAVWSPGHFSIDIGIRNHAVLVASIEDPAVFSSITPEEAFNTARNRAKHLVAQAERLAHDHDAASLALAADQFIVRPVRISDIKWTSPVGDEPKTIVAGYHWFTDWGRDTMISLEGLALLTGRGTAAKRILMTFAHHVRNGLIPNLFPEGQEEGAYHTADATLWFFHAFDRYLTYCQDREILETIYPILSNSVEWHIQGTDFGIGADPADGLLRQGAPGYQLTWMDAKVGDWVVTPRRGKTVEINALWYNGLKIMEKWASFLNDTVSAQRFGETAHRVFESFNNRFWYEAGGYLYDIVDGENGDDPACRPNQIFSISLSYPVLDAARWGTVLDMVQEELLTPVGLRSLSRRHPDYKSNYFGDLRSRDASYHQGTVWPWLLGHFVDAWLKVHPGQKKQAREFIRELLYRCNEAGIGTISEIFDGETPFKPRGCIAQAWSVAEAIRAWFATEASLSEGE